MYLRHIMMAMLACAACVQPAAAFDYYYPDQGVKIDRGAVAKYQTPTGDIDRLNAHIRAAGDEWTVQIGPYAIAAKKQRSAFEDVNYDDGATMSVTINGPQGQVAQKRVGLRDVDGEFSVRLTTFERQLHIEGGQNATQRIATVPLPAAIDGATITANKNMTLRRVKIDCDTLPYRPVRQFDGDEGTNGGLCGVWQVLDRDLDGRYAQLGGRYTLQIVPNDADGYDIYYLNGAGANALWQTGQLKGTLSPTPFADNYHLQWYDARGRLVHGSDGDNNAQVLGQELIQLSFPTLNSTMRICKISSQRP